MHVFFKSIKTFQTKAAAMVLSFELTESIYDAMSTATITKPATLPTEGDIVVFENGFIGVLDSYSVENDALTLNILQPESIFARNMFFVAQTFTYAEDYLVSLITQNFTNQGDTFYRTPYLNATAVTHTRSNILPDVDDRNIFNVRDYAAKLRRIKNIRLIWTYSTSALNVGVSVVVPTQRNIDMSYPLFLSEEEVFSSVSVGKITVFCEETQEKTDWYMHSDGTIDNNPTGTRVDGEWTVLTVNAADQVETSVIDEFAKNEYAHNITFSCPARYPIEFLDKVLVSKNNKLYKSYVSAVTLRSDSEEKRITCGELQTEFPYLGGN